MDYFILTRQRNSAIEYYCVKDIARAKNPTGEDVTVFTCSGIVSVIPTAEVVCITPSTPTLDQAKAFSK